MPSIKFFSLYFRQRLIRFFSPLWGCLMLSLFLLFACANPGAGPDGGAYDETPPRIVRMSPPLGATYSKAKKVNITFDEYIKVEKIAEKVTISPPQKNTPEINVSGKQITVQLEDSLLPHTTYTIDFSDAISDNNEGNPLGNFTYYFSTGAAVDTMEMAGHVLSADDLEPLKGILVGLHPADDDSAFTTRPFVRTGRTDANGRFSIKGIAPGKYKVYALGDIDNDFLFSQKSELIAWTAAAVTPSSFLDVRHDTIWRDTITIDSVRTTYYTHYLPDDLVLLAFKEAGQPRHFLKAVRDVPEYFRTYFTAPSSHVPTIKGLNFDAANAFIEQRSQGNDTLTYWLKDSLLTRMDTLTFLYRYEDYLDSTQTFRFVEDTLTLVPKLTNVRREKMRQKAREQFEKEREKRHRKGDFSQERMPVEEIGIKRHFPSRLAPDQNLSFELLEPADTILLSGFRLFLGPDSLQVPAVFELVRSPHHLLRYTLRAEWRAGQRYTLHVDSAAIRSIYGKVNGKMTHAFSIATTDDFGAVFVTVQGSGGKAVMELLQSGKVVATAAERQGEVAFYYVRPGSYYLRLFLDENKNGKWDTGEYAERRQPEATFYYPKSIEVKAGWDVERTFTIDRSTLLSQKPRSLVKQKAEAKKATARQRNLERKRS